MAMLGKLRRRPFGEILVSDGLISHEQLEEALAIQRTCGDTLGSILLDLGYIVETDIVKALSIQYQLPCMSPANYEIDKKLLAPHDAIYLHRHLILPVDQLGSLLLVLLCDIPTKKVLEEIQEVSKSDLAVFLGTSSEIKKALMELMPISEQDEESIRESRLASSDDLTEAAHATGEIDSIEELDISSEKLLSSLDAAWESIFVESKGSEEDDGD